MTPDQTRLVRSSFKLLEPIAPQAAALFYDNLFTADPSLRALFHGNMAQQGARLMTMISSAVHLLDQPDTLMPVLHKLGARHVNYGVHEKDYATVGAALIKTLQQGLGQAFTSEVHDAWVTLYGTVSHAMMEAGRSAAASSAQAA